MSVAQESASASGTPGTRPFGRPTALRPSRPFPLLDAAPKADGVDGSRSRRCSAKVVLSRSTSLEPPRWRSRPSAST